MGPELSLYVDVFGNFTDEAAPSPEVEVKVKGSAKEFYQKYLNNDKYILLDIVGSNSLRIHSKPHYLLQLASLDEVEYMEKVPGLYEPM
jgi:hypothetical protein